MKRERWESFVGRKATLARYGGFSPTLPEGVLCWQRRFAGDVTTFPLAKSNAPAMDGDLGYDDLG